MLGCGGKREQQDRGRDRRNLLISRDGGEAWSDGQRHGGGIIDSADAAAACQLVIAGCTSETARTEEGEHTVYCLRCVMVGCKGKERLSWEVRRRYREFFSLHSRMKTFGSVHADLPSRNPFSSMSSVIHAREKGLQEYLNLVLERCSDDQCHLLAKFLQVNKHISRSSKHASASSTAVSSPTADAKSTPASSRADSSEPGPRTRAVTGINLKLDGPGPIVPVGMVPKSSAASEADRKRSQSCPRGAMARSEAAREGGLGAAGAREGAARDDHSLPSDTPGRGLGGGGGGGGGGAGSRVAQQQHQLLSGLRQQRAAKPVAVAVGGGGDERGAGGMKAGVGLFFVENEEALCEVDEIICGSSADADGSIQVGDRLRAVDGEGVEGRDLTRVREMIIGAPDSLVTLSFERPRQYHPVTRSSLVAPHRYDVTLVRSLRRAPSVSPTAVASGAGGAGSRGAGAGGGGGSSGEVAGPKHEEGKGVGWECPGPAGRRLDAEGPSPMAARGAGGAGPVLVAGRGRAAEVGGKGAGDAGEGVGREGSGRSGMSREEAVSEDGEGEGEGEGEVGEGGGGGLRAERSEALSTVKAVCAFHAQKAHEVSLEVGELVVILRKHASGWWEGCTVKGGRRGWLPSNHVAEIDVQGIVLEQALRATTYSERTDAGEGGDEAAAGQRAGEADGAGRAAVRGSQTGSMSSGQSLSIAQTVMANLSTNSADSVEVGELLGKKGVQDWGVEEVCAWLQATELGEYAAVFRANKIDGELLSELQDRDLVEDFGITNKYHRRRLLKRLHG